MIVLGEWYWHKRHGPLYVYRFTKRLGSALEGSVWYVPELRRCGPAFAQENSVFILSDIDALTKADLLLSA